MIFPEAMGRPSMTSRCRGCGRGSGAGHNVARILDPRKQSRLPLSKLRHRCGGLCGGRKACKRLRGAFLPSVRTRRSRHGGRRPLETGTRRSLGEARMTCQGLFVFRRRGQLTRCSSERRSGIWTQGSYVARASAVQAEPLGDPARAFLRDQLPAVRGDIHRCWTTGSRRRGRLGDLNYRKSWGSGACRDGSLA
jgi:hypothetical protein